MQDILNSYNLPAAAIADDVNRQLLESQCLVVTAPPGAGKSTLLPITIQRGLNAVMQQADCGKVIVLEPRRLAARQIAMRMAQMLDEPVGKTVGYRVRFENKTSASTRIEVVTEGILTRMLIDDPMLEGVAVVIFDEFHERSIHSDVALALTREAQALVRPDLRLVIMSATIDATSICNALAAPLIESQGRMFPVEVIRAKEEGDVSLLPENVARCIMEAHRNHEGDILAFLPGQGEIMRCKEALGAALGATSILPLYGNLSPKEQQQAIMPSQEGERKVVLATNIAETSLTIEGVRVVVDSGFYRTLVYDERSGLSHLETVRISMDMANQRSGRAGRVAEGVCYRLWTLATEHRMLENRKPEILEADLTPMLLDVVAWQNAVYGDDDNIQMKWLTEPPVARIAAARSLLQMLGAIDGKGILTAHGRRLATMPCHPRMAQMLITASTASLKALACDLAALLEEKDPMADSGDCNASTRIIALREARKRGAIGRWERINRAAMQYRNMLTDAKGACALREDNSVPDPQHVGLLIAAAYPERIAYNDSLNHYRLANGENASLQASAKDTMAMAAEWIAIANMNSQHSREGRGGTIFLASPVDIADLQWLVTERDNVSWNSKQGCIVAQREQRIGLLQVSAKPIHDVPKEKLLHIVCEAARKDGRSMFSFDDDVQNMQQRVAAVREWHPELSLPDISTEAVLQCAAEWLPLYIGKATTAQELRKIDLTQALWTLLSYEQQMEVNRIAPTHLTVPTGSRIKVEYRTGAELPVLRVRLQECFGLTDTPRVDDGRRPVLMELLSPGFKPVQLTQDLASFWQGTYFEVRKELRRRYPKHYWPDNPLEAEPTRGVKKSGR